MSMSCRAGDLASLPRSPIGRWRNVIATSAAANPLAGAQIVLTMAGARFPSARRYRKLPGLQFHPFRATQNGPRGGQHALRGRFPRQAVPQKNTEERTFR